jgi:hypothetical protein
MYSIQELRQILDAMYRASRALVGPKSGALAELSGDIAETKLAKAISSQVCDALVCKLLKQGTTAEPRDLSIAIAESTFGIGVVVGMEMKGVKCTHNRTKKSTFSRRSRSK